MQPKLARFSPVAPIGILWELYKHGYLGNYHLLIATDILKHKLRYRELFLSLPGAFIIVDNGLVELGSPLSPDKTLEAASTVEADAIVLPDKLTDAKTTAELSIRAAKQLEPKLPSSTGLLAVIQGSTFAEMMACADKILRKAPCVKYLSVPRITQRVLGSRQEVTRELYRKYQLPIHLLGFSDNFADDVATALLPGVMGIDSATPVWLGLQGRKLPLEPPNGNGFGSRPENFWQQTEVNEVVISNINCVRSWLDGVPLAAVSAVPVGR